MSYCLSLFRDKRQQLTRTQVYAAGMADQLSRDVIEILNLNIDNLPH